MDCRAERTWSGKYIKKDLLACAIHLKKLLKQCGHTPCAEVSTFTLVNGPLNPVTGELEHVCAAAAGITFTLFLTGSGKST